MTRDEAKQLFSKFIIDKFYDDFEKEKQELVDKYIELSNKYADLADKYTELKLKGKEWWQVNHFLMR